METLQDHFIISMPHLMETTFDQSVVYICEHNHQGSMGIMINRPLASASVSTMLKTLDLAPSDKLDQIREVYFGGPLQPSLGFVLHSPEYELAETMKISTQISLTTSLDIITDIQQGEGPEQFRFALGYAGWANEQLEREVANGDWLVVPGSSAFIFDKPDSSKWTDAARQFGIEINQMSGPGGIA